MREAGANFDSHTLGRAEKANEKCRANRGVSCLVWWASFHPTSMYPYVRRYMALAPVME